MNGDTQVYVRGRGCLGATLTGVAPHGVKDVLPSGKTCKCGDSLTDKPRTGLHQLVSGQNRMEG